MKVVVVKPDGSFILEDKSSTTYGVFAHDYREFDCKECGKRANGIGSMSGFSEKGCSYSMYYFDPHDRNDICSVPVNIYSHKLLSCECSCGYKDECSNYRGDIHFVKYDKKQNKKVDCDENDVEVVRKEVLREKDKVPGYLGRSCIIS